MLSAKCAFARLQSIYSKTRLYIFAILHRYLYAWTKRKLKNNWSANILKIILLSSPRHHDTIITSEISLHTCGMCIAVQYRHAGCARSYSARAISVSVNGRDITDCVNKDIAYKRESTAVPKIRCSLCVSVREREKKREKEIKQEGWSPVHRASAPSWYN